MEINEDLLRKYIFHNQVLKIHNEAVAETYLEDAYNLAVNRLGTLTE